MTDLGIKNENMNSTVEVLHKHLATEIVLNLKIRNFHWNVVWMHFNDLHEFFEKMYDTGAEYADEIAERIRMLGHHTQASMGEYIKMTYVEEEKDITMDSDKMLQQLLNDTETIIREMRKDILEIAETDDMGTEDFLTGLIQKHEKDAWILRSLCNKW